MKIEDCHLKIKCILSILIQFKIPEVYNLRLPGNAFNRQANIV